MIWARMLAYITGTVDQELLLRNEYLAAENRILRAQIKGRLLLSDAEKATWAALSIPQSQWARAYYELQCRRGKKHHAAVRALAFKWIRIIYRCWKERVASDENVYLAALVKHNSPLVAATKAEAL